MPTIQSKLAENGSPRATFETTDDRLTFLVTIPAHEICKDIEGSAEKPKSSVEKQKSSVEILTLLKDRPTITAPEIAMIIGISTRAIEKQLRQLKEKGVIRRIGPNKGRHWEVISDQ